MFKKTVLFYAAAVMLIALLIPSVFTPQKSFADSAYEQAQQANDSGNNASNASNLENTKQNAGVVFDTPSDSTPVDLSGAGEHPTPKLLRKPGD